MPYENIKDIYFTKVTSRYYFFDANIWIYVLDEFNSHKSLFKKYSEFFHEVAESHLPSRPKIVLCSLLLSEIINTYMHKIVFKEFIEENYNGIQPTDFDFKKHYRPTQFYKEKLAILCDNIKAFNKSIENIDDSFVALRPFQLLKNAPANLDFNDYYYIQLCKEISNKKAISIVTNDKDFKVTDIEIITGSQELKDLRSFKS